MKTSFTRIPLLLLLISHLAGISSALNNPFDSVSTEDGDDEDSRDLQASFRATYRARFQQLITSSESCDAGAAKPVIQVYCRGELVPVAISSPRISCARKSRGNDWKGLQCVTTCGTSSQVENPLECQEELYLEREEIENGVFGHITFHCQGSSAEDVDAFMAYEGDSDLSTCTSDGVADDAANGSPPPRLAHVAQLGVQCPTAAMMNTDVSKQFTTDDSNFFYDDNHFECSPGVSTGNFNGRYTCYQEMECDEPPCELNFNEIPLEVHAEIHNLPDCIESVTGVELPDTEDLQAVSPAGDYVVQFEAAWQLNLDTNVCAGEFAPKRITCHNDTIIENVEPLFDNVECTISEDDGSVMECVDTTAENFVNGFSGVTYECHGKMLPETTLEYLSAPSECDTDGMLEEQRVGHYLQLGFVCTEANGDTVTRNVDRWVECGQGNDFNVMDGKYTCVSETKFSRDSDSNTRVDIPNLVMLSDYYWSKDRPADCFQFTALTGTGADQPDDQPEGEDDTANDSAIDIPVIGLSEPSDSDSTAAPSSSEGATVDGAAAVTTAPTTATTTTSDSALLEESSTATPTTAETVVIDFPTTAPTDASIESPTVSPTVLAAPVTIPPGTTYRARYVGRFQQILSPGCISSQPNPIIICEGRIRNVTTSDPRIVCNTNEILQLDGPGNREAILCSNVCTVGETCLEVYETTGAIGETGALGEVYFECHGDTPEEVGGEFALTEGEGFCEGNDPDELSANLNMAQLGVYCPGDGDNGTYEFDDLYSECGLNINFARRLDSDDYSCFTGRACGTEFCQLNFGQLVVDADPHRFPQCVESSNGSPVPELQDPAQPSRADGQYTSTFKALWFYLLDEQTCIRSVSAKEVSCTNGNIQMVESLVDADDCTVVDESTIRCEDSGLSGGVVYDCTADGEFPETHVKYLEGDVGCDSFDDQAVERALQLGLQCNGLGPEPFVFWDFFVECGEENTFDFINFVNYTCFSSLTVPAGSGSASFDVSATEVMTDYRWPLVANNMDPDICYRYDSGPRRRLSKRGSFQPNPKMLWETLREDVKAHHTDQEGWHQVGHLRGAER